MPENIIFAKLPVMYTPPYSPHHAGPLDRIIEVESAL